MTIYTECDKCKSWVEETSMDYFTGIGNVCQDCKNKLINNHNAEPIPKDSNSYRSKDIQSQHKELIDKDYALDGLGVKQ